MPNTKPSFKWPDMLKHWTSLAVLSMDCVTAFSLIEYITTATREDRYRLTRASLGSPIFELASARPQWRVATTVSGSYIRSWTESYWMGYFNQRRPCLEPGQRYTPSRFLNVEWPLVRLSGICFHELASTTRLSEF
jgi:hypothetical protein